jgi:transcriptional regulator with XRE-family HTH domain
MTATELLAAVLTRARATVGRSPEQVGEQVGMSGRTIRRLEDGTSARPRRMTLQALAGYYGLNPEFLVALGAWSGRRLHEEQVRDLIRERAVRELGLEVAAAADASPEEDAELAMQLARSAQSVLVPAAGPGSGRTRAALVLLRALSGPVVTGIGDRDRNDVLRVVGGFMGLDRRRRRLATELIDQLRDAQAAEADRRRSAEPGHRDPGASENAGRGSLGADPSTGDFE